MTQPQTIAIGSDHGGLSLKTAIIDHLKQQNIPVKDCGPTTDASVDYPDYAEKVAQNVLETPNTIGILCCGTGIGMSIKANRHPGIRAALVHDEFTAKMAKEHNNANILCLGGRLLSNEEAIHLVDTWLKSTFDGGRHQARVDKLG